MKTNIGAADRVTRLVVAAIIGVLYYTNTITGILGIVLLILGAVFMLTSFIGFCPIYALFGLNSCKTKSN